MTKELVLDMKQYKVTFTIAFLSRQVETRSMLISAKTELDAYRVFNRMHKTATIKKVEKI